MCCVSLPGGWEKDSMATINKKIIFLLVLFHLLCVVLKFQQQRNTNQDLCSVQPYHWINMQLFYSEWTLPLTKPKTKWTVFSVKLGVCVSMFIPCNVIIFQAKMLEQIPIVTGLCNVRCCVHKSQSIIFLCDSRSGVMLKEKFETVKHWKNSQK